MDTTESRLWSAGSDWPIHRQALEVRVGAGTPDEDIEAAVDWGAGCCLGGGAADWCGLWVCEGWAVGRAGTGTGTGTGVGTGCCLRTEGCCWGTAALGGTAAAAVGTEAAPLWEAKFAGNQPPIGYRTRCSVHMSGLNLIHIPLSCPLHSTHLDRGPCRSGVGPPTCPGFGSEF